MLTTQDHDGPRWVAAGITCLVAGIAAITVLLLFGCGATVKASGGSSTVERESHAPKTETTTIEASGEWLNGVPPERWQEWLRNHKGDNRK